MMAQGAQSNNAHAEQMRSRRNVMARSVLAMLLVIGSATVGLPAEQESQLAPVPTTGMQSGQVTDKHDASIEINGRVYSLHPNITLADDQGVDVIWADFKRGSQVQFHLKQQRIDYLILVLPR